MYNARLDDRGRIKLPADFQAFFNSLREKKLYITSLDRRIAQIYPMATWREKERSFEAYRDDPRIARILAFNAADLGGETEMDGQGRIVFPPELRRELGIEEQPLRLYAYKGRIEVLSAKIYDDRKSEATQLTPEDRMKAEAAGLN
jgi:MraZ protein